MAIIKDFSYVLSAIIILSLFSFTNANAQHKSRNSVYLELASQRPVYSINYDRIFRQGNTTDYSFNAGISIAKNAVSFPMGIHFIAGASGHHLQYSVTFIPYIDYNLRLVGSNKDQTDKYIYINPGIGYRYQALKTGLFFKAMVGPSVFLDPPSTDFWDMDPKLYGYGSVALGITF